MFRFAPSDVTVQAERLRLEVEKEQLVLQAEKLQEKEASLFLFFEEGKQEKML